MNGEETAVGTARAAWTTAVFCLAALVSYTDRLILSALVDPIRASLHISDSAVSLLQGAAFALVYVVAGLFLGRMADRHHRLAILISGVTLWCFGTIAAAFAPSFGALFAARIAVGIGEAALAPAAVSIIADTVAPQRVGTAVGVFLMGTVLGGPVSISTGAFMLGLANAGAFTGWPVVGHLAPWRAVLALVGAAGLVVPLLMLTLREPWRRSVTVAPGLGHTLTALVSDRAVLIPTYLAMGLLSVGDYGLLSWVPSVLSRRFALPPEQISWMFGLVTVAAGVAGSVAGGAGSDWAARRGSTLGRLRFSLAAAAVAAVAAGMIAVADQRAVLVGLAAWTLFSSVAAISGIAAIQELVAGDSRGVGIALVAFCNTLLGLGLGPTLVALVTDHVFADPVAVGVAVSLVVVPASLAALVLFARAIIVRQRVVQDGGQIQ
jgi:predicted MFS family arabinose efflux permease